MKPHEPFTGQDHTHDWEILERVVRVHNYRIEKGATHAVDMTARDTLKQRKCKTCNILETYDMERKTLL